MKLTDQVTGNMPDVEHDPVLGFAAPPAPQMDGMPQPPLNLAQVPRTHPEIALNNGPEVRRGDALLTNK
jgi:hypothetical protein